MFLYQLWKMEHLILLREAHNSTNHQRPNKLISSERSFKILQNETKIIKIRRVVLEIVNFKNEMWTVFREKNDRKTENVVFKRFAQTEKPWIV